MWLWRARVVSPAQTPPRCVPARSDTLGVGGDRSPSGARRPLPAEAVNTHATHLLRQCKRIAEYTVDHVVHLRRLARLAGLLWRGQTASGSPACFSRRTVAGRRRPWKSGAALFSACTNVPRSPTPGFPHAVRERWRAAGVHPVQAQQLRNGLRSPPGRLYRARAQRGREQRRFNCWPVPSCRLPGSPSIMKSASTAMAIWCC